MATTLSLVVIFLPLAFMQGRIGRFFSSYGVTVAFAILVSLFVSFTLTPMLASRFLRHTDDEALREKKAHGGPLMRWLGGHYLGMLRWSLHHRWVVVLGVLGLHGFAWSCWCKLTTFNFMPQDDSSEFEIALQTPEGSTLQRTAEIAARDRAAPESHPHRRPAGHHGHADHHRRNLRPRRQRRGRCHRGAAFTAGCRNWAGCVSTCWAHSRRWSQFEVMGRARRILADYPDVRASVQTDLRHSAAAGATRTCSSTSSARTWTSSASYAEQIIEKLRGKQGHRGPGHHALQSQTRVAGAH